MQDLGQNLGQHHVPGLDAADTLPALLAWRIAQTPLGEAYRQFDRAAGRWISCAWHELGVLVERWGQALDREGLSRGDRVALLVPNGVEHMAMDQAALSRGLVPVPLHAIDNPESIIYILADSEASLLFIDSAERWQTLVAAADRLDSLRRIVCLKGQGVPENSGGRVVSLKRWLETGRGGNADSGRPARVQATDLAAIVYTSGTTGRPKGVMLSHGNIMAN